MSCGHPEALAVRMANGDELTVTAVGDVRINLKSRIMISGGDWIYVHAKGRSPRGLWINTAQIVSIEEVDAQCSE